VRQVIRRGRAWRGSKGKAGYLACAHKCAAWVELYPLSASALAFFLGSRAMILLDLYRVKSSYIVVIQLDQEPSGQGVQSLLLSRQ
jgi:hypothetical protein